MLTIVTHESVDAKPLVTWADTYKTHYLTVKSMELDQNYLEVMLKYGLACRENAAFV